MEFQPLGKWRSRSEQSSDFHTSAFKLAGSALSCSTENHCGFCFSNLINKNNSSVADAFQSGFSLSQLTGEEVHYKL